MSKNIVVVEVDDGTGYRRVTHETDLDAAKDWLWRAVVDCDTANPSRGPVRVRIYIAGAP